MSNNIALQHNSHSAGFQPLALRAKWFWHPRVQLNSKRKPCENPARDYVGVVNDPSQLAGAVCVQYLLLGPISKLKSFTHQNHKTTDVDVLAVLASATFESDPRQLVDKRYWFQAHCFSQILTHLSLKEVTEYKSELLLFTNVRI